MDISFTLDKGNNKIRMICKQEDETRFVCEVIDRGGKQGKIAIVFDNNGGISGIENMDLPEPKFREIKEVISP